MKTHRLARVAEVVREVASETILFELRDPRVKMVTVTRAEVSGDLQNAKVYVSVMGDERQQQLTLRGLKHAAGFIQSKLGDRLKTRYTPVLTFVLDQGVKNSLLITRLINEALAPQLDPGEAKPPRPPQTDPASAEQEDSEQSQSTDQLEINPPQETGSEAQANLSGSSSDTMDESEEESLRNPSTERGKES